MKSSTQKSTTKFRNIEEARAARIERNKQIAKENRDAMTRYQYCYY